MIRLLTVLICVQVGLGCANRDARPVNYSVRAAPSEDRAVLLDAAEAALIGAGYSIARRDTAGGLIVSQPIAIDRTGERTVRADSPTRKVAEVRVTGAGEALSVHCKVIVQEQANESYRLQAFEREGDDVPGHRTAIDKDAATTAGQNTIWRSVRRDKTAEREILDRITEPTAAP